MYMYIRVCVYLRMMRHSPACQALIPTYVHICMYIRTYMLSVVCFPFIYCPSSSSVDDLLPAFIGCLESQDHTIIRAAVPSLPDLLLLCKGKWKQHCVFSKTSHHKPMHACMDAGSDASYLLKMLFLLATHSSYNCTGALVKCVEAFTQHTIK